MTFLHKQLFARRDVPQPPRPVETRRAEEGSRGVESDPSNTAAVSRERREGFLPITVSKTWSGKG
jgi:hypothetical protein